jgi:drug/metabolite transporter (DMT)-like permease
VNGRQCRRLPFDERQSVFCINVDAGEFGGVHGDEHVHACTGRSLPVAGRRVFASDSGVRFRLHARSPSEGAVHHHAAEIDLATEPRRQLPRLPLANTAVLTNTAPLWIGLLSWPILGKPPTKGVWAAIVVSLFGVALILRPEREVDVWASAAAAGAAVSSAFAMMGLHRVAALDHRAVVAHFSATAALFTFLASIAFGGGRFPTVPDDARVWQLLIAVGLTATVGQLCMTRAYARGNPASVAVVGLSQVVFGLIIDVVFWNRHVDVWTLLGIALVAVPTGCLMTSRRGAL